MKGAGVEMSSPEKVATVWTAEVATVPQLARLDMRAPLSGQRAFRRRAAALRRRLAQGVTSARVRVTTDTLRKLVR